METKVYPVRWQGRVTIGLFNTIVKHNKR